MVCVMQRWNQTLVLSWSQSGVENLLAADVNLRNDKLLFCSPEVLARVRWREAIDDPAVSSRIVAVAVDEAHCISKW